MAMDKTLDQKKLDLISQLDHAVKSYNYLVGSAVLAEAIATTIMSGKLLQFAFALYFGEFEMALEIANEAGLIEKCADSGVHIFNAGVSKDSPNWKIDLAIALDIARIVMAYYYGSNHTTKIPTFLNYLDLGANHPLNFIANGMRRVTSYFEFFSSKSATPSIDQAKTILEDEKLTAPYSSN